MKEVIITMFKIATYVVFGYFIITYFDNGGEK